jgi:hypothetical protein
MLYGAFRGIQPFTIHSCHTTDLKMESQIPEQRPDRAQNQNQKLKPVSLHRRRQEPPVHPLDRLVIKLYSTPTPWFMVPMSTTMKTQPCRNRARGRRTRQTHTCHATLATIPPVSRHCRNDLEILPHASGIAINLLDKTRECSAAFRSRELGIRRCPVAMETADSWRNAVLRERRPTDDSGWSGHSNRPCHSLPRPPPV